MTGYVTDARGAQWALPVPLAWRMEHTAGTPCDSFWLTCPWDGGQSAQPGDGGIGHAVPDDKQIFHASASLSPLLYILFQEKERVKRKFLQVSLFCPAAAVFWPV